MIRKVTLACAACASMLALTGCGDRGAGAPRPPPAPRAPLSSVAQRLPLLVDLGAGRCIPCKAMAPILEQLRADYAGKMEVRFIDVWKDPDQGRAYGIHLIPTQIFYAADGRELARHEGFISRDDILAEWSKLGVTF